MWVSGRQVEGLVEGLPRVLELAPFAGAAIVPEVPLQVQDRPRSGLLGAFLGPWDEAGTMPYGLVGQVLPTLHVKDCAAGQQAAPVARRWYWPAGAGIDRDGPLPGP